MAVCCMLLPHNPYRLPQHYKRHVCSCKLRFLWISPIFEHHFCLIYMCTVCHWKHFWSAISVCFIGQCWYLNLLRTPLVAINKAGCVWNHMRHLGQNAQLLCWHTNQGIWRGLGGGGVHSGSTKRPWPSRVLLSPRGRTPRRGKRKMETESPHPNMPSAVWETKPRTIGSRGAHLVYHR